MIPGGRIENTTRSRSFLFFSFGICAISGMNGVNALQVPENGLIALNVPLDDLRVGSHSTRTTHPFYMTLWNNVLNDLGFQLSLENPYWNKTKGEMANECLNKEFLFSIIADSNSCSSPQKARWQRTASCHCGYCVPCIIRRAAMQRAFGVRNDNTKYLVNQVSDIITNHAKRKGEQLRSFQIAIQRLKECPQLANILIHKTGPLSDDESYLCSLSNVYSRGLMEIDAFIVEELARELRGNDGN